MYSTLEPESERNKSTNQASQGSRGFFGILGKAAADVVLSMSLEFKQRPFRREPPCPPWRAKIIMTRLVLRTRRGSTFTSATWFPKAAN